LVYLKKVKLMFNRFIILLFICVYNYNSKAVASLGSDMNQHGMEPALVGSASDNLCQFSSIQTAINAGHDEIRVANNMIFDERITIQNKSLDIKGGYVNCFAAESDSRSSHPTTNLNNSKGTVITINNDADTYQINLSQLYINNGVQDSFSNAAGISITGSDTSVFIDGSRISENQGTGIAIVDTQLVHLSDIIVSSNLANPGSGAGIYCDASSVVVSGGSVISNNEAISDTLLGIQGTSGLGGALYATNDCHFNYYSGPDNFFTSNNGFISNTANKGGAIYADQSSQINIISTEVTIGNQVLGDSNSPVLFLLNSSEQDGGAIYVDGTNTILTTYGVSFRQNEVGRDGGAIYVNDNATAVMTRLPSGCWSNSRCNEFFRNASGISANSGGAIIANSATLAIGNAWFEENKSDQGVAITLLGSQATVEGSVFYKNRVTTNFDANETIGAFFSSDLTVAYSTFVDNNPAESTLQIGSGSNLTLVGSILYDPFDVALTTVSPGQINNYCVYTNDATGLTGTQIIESDNEPFVDRLNEDFHIADATLVDVCDTSIYTPSLRDFDNETRGFDTDAPDIDGFYDIGADEDYSSDVIYRNSFESAMN